MMPEYVDVPLDYEPWRGSLQPVFRKTDKTFCARDVKQNTPAEGSERQQFFEMQLERILSALGNDDLPVFIRWNDGTKMRLDLGCIGHSACRGFIIPPSDAACGYVTQVTLRRRQTDQ